MAKAKPYDLKTTLSFLGKYLLRHKGQLLVISLFAMVSAFANVFGAYLLKPIINNYILPGDTSGLATALVFLGVMYTIGILSTIASTQRMVTVAQQIIFEIRQDLFHRIQSLPMKYLDEHTHGELMSRFTNDIDVVSEGLNTSFTICLENAVSVVSTFIILIALNIRLSFVVVGTFLIVILFLQITSRKSRVYFREQQQYLAELNGFIEERLEGQKVVQVFNHEEQDLADFKKHNESLRVAGTKAHTLSRIVVPITVSISYINYSVTAGIGAFMAIAGIMDIGTLSSYLVLVRQSTLPMHQFSNQLNLILSALSGAEHIQSVMEQTPEVDEGTIQRVPNTRKEGGWAWKNPYEATLPYPLKGQVLVENVTFGYRNNHPVLKHLNVMAQPGQKIAFVGATGAGKTTITNLLNRFYEIDEGAIYFDGIDIRAIKKQDLRRSLSTVLQDTHLFTGTIADNIRYGRREATDDEVIAAAKLANAHSFITRLRHGYGTMLTGDGENLSQGQRQLLSIARAATTDPSVLILDEATSSVDTYTEQQIEIGMDHLMEGRTVFVIAHRLSTVRNADTILVLEQGEVIERGSHEELVAKKGHYYKLYTGQFELA